MKRILSILSVVAVVALVMTSCGKKPAETKGLSYADTVGLSQFQAWKFQNEQAAAMQYQQPNYYQNAVQKSTATAPRRTTSTKSSNYGSGSMNSGSNNYAKTTQTQKKGWSKAAKGAAIGGGAGAIAGAVLLKKNRVAGGVVGGVVGAGIGYLIGRSKDKKDGRY